MSIPALQARIVQNQEKILQLESENRILENKIDKMYDEEGCFCKYSSQFQTLLASEKNNVSSIQSIKNVRAAQACGQEILEFSSGAKAESALSGLEKISNVFKEKIAECEEKVENNKLEIQRLNEDIGNCHHEIARIQEEQRREAERNAAKR